MKLPSPIKLDIEPGVEWLLPAAKRWLAQAKKIGRSVGSKVFLLDTGERASVTWGPSLDYIRIIAAKLGKVVGRSYTSSASYVGYIWSSGARVDMVHPSTVRGTNPSKISVDGSIAAGDASLAAAPYYTRVFRWDDTTGVEVIADGIVVGSVPRSGAALPYVNTFVRAMSSDGLVIAGVRTARAGVFPEAFIWTRDTGATALGFIDGLGTGAPYGYDLGNKSSPTCMSEDGSIIFGYSGGENFYNGGVDPAIGCRWTAATGWTRLPLVYAYPTSALYTNDAGTMVVGNTSDGTQTRPYMYSDANGAEILPMPWDSPTLATTVAGVSPNGKYVVGSIGSARSCVWEIDQTTYAVTATELPMHRATAVLDDGTVFGHHAPVTAGQYIPARWSQSTGLALAVIDPLNYGIVTTAGPAGAVGVTDVYGSSAAGAQGFFWPKIGGPLQLIDTLVGHSYNTPAAISGGSND